MSSQCAFSDWRFGIVGNPPALVLEYPRCLGQNVDDLAKKGMVVRKQIDRDECARHSFF